MGYRSDSIAVLRDMGPQRTVEKCCGMGEFFAEDAHVSRVCQDHGEGGLSLRGVAVTTETATTAETAKTVKTVKTVSRYCIL